MRGAPPVQMACGRDAAWSWFVGIVAAAAAASLWGWIAWHGLTPADAVVPGTLLAALCGGMLARRRAGQAPLARLTWDGRGWQLDGASGHLAVMIDTGGWMLLRWRGVQGIRWLPLTPRRCGVPAHLARTAIHAHAGRPLPQGPAAPEPHG
jgi:hypothetical protein